MAQGNAPWAILLLIMVCLIYFFSIFVKRSNEQLLRLIV